MHRLRPTKRLVLNHYLEMLGLGESILTTPIKFYVGLVISTTLAGGGLWNQESGIVSVSTFGNFAYPRGMNNYGQMIGSEYINGNPTGYGLIGDLNSGFRQLDKLSDEYFMVPLAVNDRGESVGYCYKNGIVGSFGVVWNTNGSIASVLGDPNADSQVVGINYDGQAVWQSNGKSYLWDSLHGSA